MERLFLTLSCLMDHGYRSREDVQFQQFDQPADDMSEIPEWLIARIHQRQQVNRVKGFRYKRTHKYQACERDLFPQAHSSPSAQSGIKEATSFRLIK